MRKHATTKVNIREEMTRVAKCPFKMIRMVNNIIKTTRMKKQNMPNFNQD